jgi:hypothetical protein
LVDGTIVAADFDDLVTCDVNGANCLQHPINLAETGSDPGHTAWTGTLSSGSFEGDDCSGWLALDGVIGTYGSPGATDEEWTALFSEQFCTDDRGLYCFQQ